MQNSPDRLFQAMARSLRADVLPGLSDPYARAQVTAAIEILGNLASRVVWRADIDHDAMAELAAEIAGGADDEATRAAMLAALDDELARLRTARFGEER
ncbi:MAG: hypothetical protein GY720_20810 [bacterium]|nr:hypothetical protein [bacterium]